MYFNLINDEIDDSHSFIHKNTRRVTRGWGDKKIIIIIIIKYYYYILFLKRFDYYYINCFSILGNYIILV